MVVEVVVVVVAVVEKDTLIHPMRFLNASDHCYRYKRCLYEVSYVI